MISQILRERAAATLAGTAPAAFPQAAPTQVFVQSPKPEIRTLFFLRDARWIAETGERLVRKFSDADLPLVLAAKALALGVAIEVNDERRKNLLGTASGWPAREWCINLSDDTSEQPREPVVQFQRVDRGAPRQFKVSRIEPEVAAARSADDVEER